jgi:protein SSD1
MKVARSGASWRSRFDPQPYESTDTDLLHVKQIAIQNEIEALQRQQAALYQQQLASNQVLSFQTPGLAPNRAAAHRRVQSTVPMAAFGSPSGQQGLMSQLGLRNLSLGLDGQPQGIPHGHGRRHSVNVVNKPGSQSSLGIGQDGYEDGFAPPALGGHSRQVSRNDSAWRLSMFPSSVL